jgi:hypothetical protein
MDICVLVYIYISTTNDQPIKLATSIAYYIDGTLVLEKLMPYEHTTEKKNYDEYSTVTSVLQISW